MSGRHSKEKKEGNKISKSKSQRRKKKGNDDPEDQCEIRDMELPDDFSIAGGSSVFSGDFLDEEHGDEYIDDLSVEHMSEDPKSCSADAAVARQYKLKEALSISSTISSEKRSTKRESAYRVIFKCLTQYAAGSEGRRTLESNWDSIKEACLGSLRGTGNSTPAEQYAACRVMEACAVVLGDDRDDIVEELNDPLKKIVNATGRVAQVRSAALRCLAMVHFICGTDCLEEGSDCFSVMDLCTKVCGERFRGENVDSLLRATALDSWALLSTTIHDVHIAGDDGDFDLGMGLKLLPLLASCLDSPVVGLRISAGECVALIHECRLNLGLDEDADNTTVRRFRRGSWDGSEWEVLMDEVKQRVAELSVESGHHMSKKSKRQQRSTFREFMNTIVDDESPVEVINFRGGRLTLNSWKEIVQLNFVRHCLQGGFQTQLMTNSTLHDIFGADGQILCDAANSSLSQLEKRLIMSKTSEAAKAADKAMTKQRRTRINIKNHFLTADGQDI